MLNEPKRSIASGISLSFGRMPQHSTESAVNIMRQIRKAYGQLERIHDDVTIRCYDRDIFHYDVALCFLHVA